MLVVFPAVLILPLLCYNLLAFTLKLLETPILRILSKFSFCMVFELLVISVLIVRLLLLGFVNVSLRVIRGLVLVLVFRSLVMMIMSCLLKLLPMLLWSTFGVAGLFRLRLPWLRPWAWRLRSSRLLRLAWMRLVTMDAMGLRLLWVRLFQPRPLAMLPRLCPSLHRFRRPRC